MVEDAVDDGIGYGGDVGRAAVEGWAGGEEDGAGFEEGYGVAGVDEAPWGLAGDEDELAALFEEDVGGAKHGGLAGAGGDAAKGAHGTGDDDHRIEAGGAADEGNLHAGAIAMLDDAIGDAEGVNFLDDDLPGMGAEKEVDFVGARVEAIQEALEVYGAAGAGACDDEFQAGPFTAGWRS